MVRRPVAWIVAVVLLAEALGIAALNWFMGVVVDRQNMSMAGLDPDKMSMSAKIGGVVFGLYFALCALVALLVAIRNRAPAGLGRVLLISVAVVHGLLGAVAWGLVGWKAFLYMVVVLALVVLLLMTYDRENGAVAAAGGDAGGGDTGEGADASDSSSGSEDGGPAPAPEPEPVTKDAPPAAPVTPPAPTTP
ncbi:hypothetical protein ABZX77_49895 [Streptomyces sp. NPDC004237]|uniref:hypothetical protein n=1 Tax=Streptomyces sp. NPDC004237 TaxID=3154455 RepID=UPI0033BFACBD